jgi:hypothetical protein
MHNHEVQRSQKLLAAMDAPLKSYPARVGCEYDRRIVLRGRDTVLIHNLFDSIISKSSWLVRECENPQVLSCPLDYALFSMGASYALLYYTLYRGLSRYNIVGCILATMALIPVMANRRLTSSFCQNRPQGLALPLFP